MSRVLISMPEQFLNKIDGIADNENRSRSELIREALRTYIDNKNLKNDFSTNPIRSEKWQQKQWL